MKRHATLIAFALLPWFASCAVGSHGKRVDYSQLIKLRSGMTCEEVYDICGFPSSMVPLDGGGWRWTYSYETSAVVPGIASGSSRAVSMDFRDGKLVEAPYAGKKPDAREESY